jgi:hypothetical protein
MPNWQTWTVADVVRWLIEHGPRSMFDPTIISLLRHTLALGPQGVKMKTIYSDVFVRSRRQVFSANDPTGTGKREPHGPDPELLQDMMSGALIQRLLIDQDDSCEAAFSRLCRTTAYCIRTYSGLISYTRSLGRRSKNRLPALVSG